MSQEKVVFCPGTDFWGSALCQALHIILPLAPVCLKVALLSLPPFLFICRPLHIFLLLHQSPMALRKHQFALCQHSGDVGLLKIVSLEYTVFNSIFRVLRRKTVTQLFSAWVN